jgi:RNA-directed DNA polymerase
MRVRESLVDALDWRASIEATLSPRGEFFPSRVEASAARRIPERLQAALSAKLRAGRPLDVPDVVYVPRRTIGTRPAYDASFADRVVLMALSRYLAQQLESLGPSLLLESITDRTSLGSLDEFERQPLEHDRAGAIVIADVSAFYEYVDHELLATEILELTGDVDLADGITSALEELVGRVVGLPQGPRASDVFANFYLSQIDRRLARLGIAAYRHNDEFRLPVRSVSEGERVLLQLERELRGIGLVLNPAKTRIPTRAQYLGWLQAVADRLQSAREAAAFDPDAFYGFDPDAFAEAAWDDLPIEQIESEFLGALTDTDQSGPDISARLIADFLPILAGAESKVPLSHLSTLVRRHPSLMRSISLYLRNLASTDSERQMTESVHRVLRSPRFLNPWVEGWLLDPLIYCDRTFSRALRGRLRIIMGDSHRPWFARARAAVVLGTEQDLPDQDVFVEMFDVATAPARADLVAAVLLGEPDWSEKFLSSLAPDDLLLSELPGVASDADAHTAYI